MRLAISNIAWDIAEDQAMAALLKRYGIDAIDVAPGKYFLDPATATTGQISDVRDVWAERGIDITGMQALLFGTQGLNLFAGPASQTAMLQHLSAVCRIGAGLGATRLVFGSRKTVTAVASMTIRPKKSPSRFSVHWATSRNTMG